MTGDSSPAGFVDLAQVKFELQSMSSAQSSKRLEQVASLRATGVSNYIDLPQLVVCGDQSAGKSSVLEGITGIPFPRQDGLCTRFATEIIIEHEATSKTNIEASIIPADGRDQEEKDGMLKYRSNITSFAELPTTIAEVGELMGIRGYGENTEGPAFVHDVLRIRVSGPTHMHLTVVDLPGLISTANEDQTQSDVDTVHGLVDSYAQSSRTIIMAVVQASNDIANQAIVQKARKFDPTGQRTVGIITKPDLINEGTEKRIALLAKNQDTTKLKLGFFLLKNPTPNELARGITLEERQQKEVKFFGSSPWKDQGLDPARVGIHRLKNFLVTLLDQHIEMELPKVRDELKSMIKAKEAELAGLGVQRDSPAKTRMFLSKLAMQFHGLALAALQGSYTGPDAKFFKVRSDGTSDMRLIGLVRNLNDGFSNYMQEYGEKRKVVNQISEPFADEPPSCYNGGDAGECLLINEDEMKQWIEKVHISTRGPELPGNYNHMLLSELFHEQSERWPAIAQKHLEKIYLHVQMFATDALKHVMREDSALPEVKELVDTALQQCLEDAEKELGYLESDELQNPMTHNHYFTENVRKDREAAMRDFFKNALDGAQQTAMTNDQSLRATLGTWLQSKVVVDMNKQSCNEALNGLNAYFKVARKTWVDNVCRQVIDRHLMRNLPSLFNSDTVSSFLDDEVQRIAGDTADRVEKRVELGALLENLKSGLKELRR